MRLAWFVSCGALAVWAGAATVSACGGSTANSDVIDSTDASSDGASSSSSGSTSSSGSSGGATDGGGTTDGSSSGAATPNQVACGSTSCATPTEKCCATGSQGADGGITVDAGCIAAASSCQGAVARCDDRTDCTNNQVCCANLGGGGVGTRCEATCGSGFQVCKVSSECEDGGTCTEYTCFGGQKISLCRKPQYGCQ